MSDDDRSLFLNKEPFRRLCNELRDLINHPSDVLDRPSDPLALKDYMFQYSKQKFAERFNFEFDGDNSKPPNSKAGGLVLGYLGYKASSDFPGTKDAVEHWMNVVLFK